MGTNTKYFYFCTCKPKLSEFLKPDLEDYAYGVKAYVSRQSELSVSF